MALATFRSHEFAGAGQAEPLGGRLVGLQLVLLPRFCFARHCWFSPFRENKTAGLHYARGRSTSLGPATIRLRSWTRPVQFSLSFSSPAWTEPARPAWCVLPFVEAPRSQKYPRGLVPLP